MAVRLHRCPIMWPKTDRHACWRVQRALDDAGVEYEIVEVPVLPRSRRTEVIAGTGQNRVPAIQLEDGSWWREESALMADAIRAGRLGAGPNP